MEGLEPVSEESHEGFSKDLNAEYFFFFAPDCPVSINYTLFLREFSKNLSADEKAYLIVPSPFYSKKEVVDFQEEYFLNIPSFLDPENELVKAFDASVTPEVVAVDSVGKVFYQGRIDDWIESLGVKRRSAQNNYLLKAIENYHSGKPVDPNYVEPVGCLIE